MRCPVCRAENAESICRRCRADLSLLVALERQRSQLLSAASSAIACGNGRQAAAHASLAARLRREDDASRLLALSQLICRDFSAAWTTLKQLQSRLAKE